MLAAIFRILGALLNAWLVLALLVALATVGGSLALVSACSTQTRASP